MQSGVTPLRVAAAQGHADVVAALLAAGAAPDLADKVRRDCFSPQLLFNHSLLQ